MIRDDEFSVLEFAIHHPTVAHNPTPIILFSFFFSPMHTPRYRKDAKKVQKLEAQIPYHEGRGNLEEANKIREQIADIMAKAKAGQA